MKYKEGDELILHSENGNEYRIAVVSANEFRPPEAQYAVDIFDSDGQSVSDDVLFVSENFLDKCEETKNEKKTII